MNGAFAALIGAYGIVTHLDTLVDPGVDLGLDKPDTLTTYGKRLWEFSGID
jgi:hypothetical protein